MIRSNLRSGWIATLGLVTAVSCGLLLTPVRANAGDCPNGGCLNGSGVCVTNGWCEPDGQQCLDGHWFPRGAGSQCPPQN